MSDRDKDLFVKVNATAEERKKLLLSYLAKPHVTVLERDDKTHTTLFMLAVWRGSSHCNTNLSWVTIATATAHKYNNGVIQCVSIEEKKVQET